MSLARRFVRSASLLTLSMVLGLILSLSACCGCLRGRKLSRPARVDLEYCQGEPNVSDLAPVSGRVTDAETGTPIAFAAVWIPEYSLGAFTNREGFVEIVHVPPGKHMVEARVIGYSNLVFEIDLNPGWTVRADIALRPTEPRMDAVPVY